MTSKLPAAINSDMLTQQLGKELLLYDLKTNKAYSLNETAAIIYLACEGETSFEELKAQTDFSDDLIFLALEDLRKENLIDKNYQSNLEGVSRREVIKRIGLTTITALPLISSLIAPTVANARSSGVNPATCPADPVGACIDTETYRAGPASSLAECQTIVDAGPPCCSNLPRFAEYYADSNCCFARCVFPCGPLNC